MKNQNEFDTKNWDWNKFFDLSAKQKESLYAKAFKKASHWVTCATGQSCQGLPRDNEGAPKDIELFNYGMAFFGAISGKNYGKAKLTLCKIEKRTKYLLNQLDHGKKKN